MILKCTSIEQFWLLCKGWFALWQLLH